MIFCALPFKKYDDMETEQRLADLVNSLIKVNKGRGYCYEKFMRENAGMDMELIQLFSLKLEESNGYAEKLSSLKVYFAFDSEDCRVVSFDNFIIWKQAVRRLKSHTNNGLLYASEYVDDVVLEVYKSALHSPVLKNFKCREIIMDQKYSLLAGQNKIKKYIDMLELTVPQRSQPLLLKETNL